MQTTLNRSKALLREWTRRLSRRGFSTATQARYLKPASLVNILVLISLGSTRRFDVARRGQRFCTTSATDVSVDYRPRLCLRALSGEDMLDFARPLNLYCTAL